MRNPIAVILPDQAPSLAGHPLRFGVICSVHRTAAAAVKARVWPGRSPELVVRYLNARALPGERVRIDHLREVVL